MSVSLDDEITNRIETFRKTMNAPCPPFATDGIEETFESVEKALTENKDIESNSDTFETGVDRMRVKDTDTGKEISE